MEITTYFAVISDKLKDCYECLEIIVGIGKKKAGHLQSTNSM
jgi:hypothetical protein